MSGASEYDPAQADAAAEAGYLFADRPDLEPIEPTFRTVQVRPHERKVPVKGSSVDVATARRTDPATSHEAAGKVDLPKLQTVVALVLRDSVQALCDEEVLVRARQRDLPGSPSGLRTARKALERKGLAEEAGDTLTSSGNRSLTFRLTEAGMALVQEA